MMSSSPQFQFELLQKWASREKSQRLNQAINQAMSCPPARTISPCNSRAEAIAAAIELHNSYSGSVGNAQNLGGLYKFNQVSDDLLFDSSDLSSTNSLDHQPIVSFPRDEFASPNMGCKSQLSSAVENSFSETRYARCTGNNSPLLHLLREANEVDHFRDVSFNRDTKQFHLHGIVEQESHTTFFPSKTTRSDLSTNFPLLPSPGSMHNTFQGTGLDNGSALSFRLLQEQTRKANIAQYFPIADFVAGSELTCIELRGQVADSFFVAIAQMKICRLDRSDQVGKYKHRKLDSIGMCCKWCNGKPGEGRYFPGSFDSFLNGTNREAIIEHIGQKCKACPPQICYAVQQLESLESSSPSKPRYGSRKRFFSHVWSRLTQHRDMLLKMKATNERGTTMGYSNKRPSASVESSNNNIMQKMIPFMENCTVMQTKRRRLD